MMLERAVQERLAMVMLGDLNCNLLKSNSQSHRLAFLTMEFDLTQMIKAITRVTHSSESLTDHF